MIPESHPRAESLRIRRRLADGYGRGLVAKEGLMAHGRGEAFDYLLGEKTSDMARRAIRTAAAMLLAAKRPVVSVNGNVAALCPGQIVELAHASGAALEINLFYGGAERREAIRGVLEECGASGILGMDPDSLCTLRGLDSDRRTVDRNGIYAADVVVVPLEDGDRTEALAAAGKRVIAFDLNPLSRTAQAADITIVDNIVRAVGILVGECGRLAAQPGLEDMAEGFDNAENLSECVVRIRDNLSRMAGIA